MQKLIPTMSTPPSFAMISSVYYRVIFRDGSEWCKQHMVHLLYCLMGPEHAEQLNGVVHDFHVAAEHYCQKQTASKDGIRDIVKHYRDFVQVLIILDVRTGKPLVLSNTIRHGTKLMEHGRIATQLLENLHYDSPRWQRMRQDCLALVACETRTPRLLFTNYKIELLFRKKSQDDKLRMLLEGKTLLHPSEFEETIAEAVRQCKAPQQMFAWCTDDVARNPRLCTSLAILAMMADKVCMDYSAEDCWSTAPLEQTIKDHKDDVQEFSRERALDRQVGLVLTVDGQRCTVVRSAAGCIGIEKDQGCGAGKCAKRAKLAAGGAAPSTADAALSKAAAAPRQAAAAQSKADAVPSKADAVPSKAGAAGGAAQSKADAAPSKASAAGGAAPSKAGAAPSKADAAPSKAGAVPSKADAAGGARRARQMRRRARQTAPSKAGAAGGAAQSKADAAPSKAMRRAVHAEQGRCSGRCGAEQGRCSAEHGRCSGRCVKYRSAKCSARCSEQKTSTPPSFLARTCAENMVG